MGLAPGFNSDAARRLTGASYRQLDHWDRSKLVRPSLQAATGSGSRRTYSFQDVVELLAVVKMRQAGISLQAIRQVASYLRQHHKSLERPLASLQITSQGRRAFIQTGNPKTFEEVTAKGQLVMVIPVGAMKDQLRDKVSELFAPREFALRVHGREFRVLATPDSEDGGYVLTVPDLPGCISEADTLRQARREAREAIELVLGEGVEVVASRRTPR